MFVAHAEIVIDEVITGYTEVCMSRDGLPYTAMSAVAKLVSHLQQCGFDPVGEEFSVTIREEHLP